MDIFETKKQKAFYGLNDEIIHKDFGRGIICDKGKDLVEIDFNGERKTMHLEVLIKGGMIQKP
ncbi:hypothetical protein PP175_19890 [Aneurinibacillus sp. Ricciae_BoGa-3]|uniref:hypothetical protein n=1 Tax=Aneurinibacillus sp. Ricciae_BoGa-3 TaxID=3022697 RepID=UPI002340DEC7|nr:hypothetical protein [Aneurinibacillus sp. Ricciae_BoGa-3]WCK53573.1 hypothetical protein PP175_19890 [Aneurinibacillus sp. Ricciae_BoGa-3]